MIKGLLNRFSIATGKTHDGNEKSIRITASAEPIVPVCITCSQAIPFFSAAGGESPIPPKLGRDCRLASLRLIDKTQKTPVLGCFLCFIGRSDWIYSERSAPHPAGRRSGVACADAPAEPAPPVRITCSQAIPFFSANGGEKRNGRSDWIRTSGLLIPNQMRYQTALRSVYPLPISNGWRSVFQA